MTAQNEPRPAREVDHHRVIGAAQQRQRRLRDPHDPDRVGVELSQGARAGDALGADDAVPDAGVVDKHVELALALLDLRERRLHGGVVGHVERDVGAAQLSGGRLSALGVAGTDVDGVAEGDQAAGGLEAEALVGAGD